MRNPTPSTWFITGASSGIGLALAEAAAGRGDNVVALARRVASLDGLAGEHGPRVLVLAADVRRQADVEDAVSRAVAAFGRIDVVADNAGYGLFGAVEESTDQQARAIFDTNVFGMLHVRGILVRLGRAATASRPRDHGTGHDAVQAPDRRARATMGQMTMSQGAASTGEAADPPPSRQRLPGEQSPGRCAAPASR